MYSMEIENLKSWSPSEHSSSLVPASNGEQYWIYNWAGQDTFPAFDDL